MHEVLIEWERQCTSLIGLWKSLLPFSTWLLSVWASCIMKSLCGPCAVCVVEEKCICSRLFTANSSEILLRKFLVLWQDMFFLFLTQFSSIEDVCMLSSVLCSFLFFFLKCATLAVSRLFPSVFLQFVSQSGGWAGRTHPFFFTPIAYRGRW